MKYNPVGWFEIPVVDMDRAEKFYSTLLGVEMARQPVMDGFEMSWFPMGEDAYGAAGTLAKHEMYKPAAEGGVVVYFTAPDLDATLARVEEAGGKIVWPKKDIGEYGTIAGIMDTEGNTVALHMAKEK